MKKILITRNIIFRLIITALFLALVAYKISFSVVVDTIQSYSLEIVTLTVCIQMVAVMISALRWRILLRELSFSELLRFSFVGQFYSLALFGQITGEIAKVYRLSRRNGKDGGKITTSIVFDKVMGLMGLIFITISGLYFSDFSERNVTLAWVSALFFFFILVLVILGNKKFQKVVVHIFHTLKFESFTNSSFFTFIQEIINNVFVYSRKPKIILLSFSLSVVYQLLCISIISIFAWGLHIQVPIVNYLWIFGLMSLAVTLPVTIAGLGIREGVLVFLLLQFSVSAELSLTLSLSIFSLQVIVACIGGVLELMSFYKNKQMSIANN